MSSSWLQPCSVFLLLVCVEASSHGDCIRSGSEYRGEQQTSSSGLFCLSWTNTTRDYDVQDHPDPQTGVGDHNYCRNPDSAPGGPWCYVSGPDGTLQRQTCSIHTCTEETPPAQTQPPSRTRVPQGPAERPVMGVSQRVHTGPRKKKDLGMLGYVLGILMMAVIILLGAGITLGYFYKRGRDLQRQRAQRVLDQELQRISLPLSAFSNAGCELEEGVAVTVEGGATAGGGATPGQEDAEGGAPLVVQQAGTPGA